MSKENSDTPAIVVSNRSPYDFDRGGPRRGSGGLVHALKQVLSSKTLWIGISRGQDDFQKADAEHRIPAEGFTMRKVFVPEATYQEYYNNFANAFIWPLMHLSSRRLDKIVPEFPTPRALSDSYAYYRLVNSEFAGAIIEEAKFLQKKYPDSEPTIWIHDYHFMELAGRLRKASGPYDLPCRIGQTWHIPWVDPNILFDLVPFGSPGFEELRHLVTSMMGNDVITFHTKRYAENFAQTALGMLAYGAITEVESGWDFDLGERVVHVRALPVGVPVSDILEASTTDVWCGEEAHKINTLLAQKHVQGNPVCVGLERLDYTKGIIPRLHIFEELLKKGYDATYISYAQPSRGDIPAYKELREKVLEVAHDINHRYTRDEFKPIYLEIDSGIEPPANYILLKYADICLVTTLSDGMNLVVLEAILSKHDLSPKERGFIVVGECGASSVLSKFGEADGILRLTDPLDEVESAREIACAYDRKLFVSDRLIQHIKENHDVSQWGKDVLSLIKK